MKEYVADLLTINYFEFLMALVTVIVGFVVIKEALERFGKALGIEFKWIRENREQQECQPTVKSAVTELLDRQGKLEEREANEEKLREENDKVILESIQDIKVDIENLGSSIKEREAKRRFKKIRYDLLNFANKISESERVSAELIRQVYREIHEYEYLVKSHGFKNNQVNASIDVITKKYQEMVLNGQIITHEDDSLDDNDFDDAY